MRNSTTLTERDDADVQAWFYLDHRQDIETWSALVSDARRLVDRHLVALTPTFEELAAQLDAEPVFSELEDDSDQWPWLGLRRRAWQHAGMADISVVLEWDRFNLLSRGRYKWPFVAVRLPRAQQDGPRRHQITDAVAPVHTQLRGGRKAGPWPYYRFIIPPGEIAKFDMAAYADSLVTGFRELWETAAPALDALHAGDAAATAGYARPKEDSSP